MPIEVTISNSKVHSKVKEDVIFNTASSNFI